MMMIVRPPMVLLNAIPVGDLGVQYTVSAHEQRWQEAAQARIPPFTRWNVYDFPNVRREGVAIKARLEDQAPWSQPVAFARGSEADTSRTLQLQQRTDGAACGVLVEEISGFEIRLSCPTWFVDRTGLNRPISLELRHRGRLLPRLG